MVRDHEIYGLLDAWIDNIGKKKNPLQINSEIQLPKKRKKKSKTQRINKVGLGMN